MALDSYQVKGLRFLSTVSYSRLIVFVQPRLKKMVLQNLSRYQQQLMANCIFGERAES